MLQKVSYDERQHAQYQRGRAFSRERLTRWIETFAAYAPNARPLAVLDLGSGTGRLTPALAKAFGGPVYGVEPSQKMRGISESSAGHSAVVYRDGSAECIPLANASVDLVLMYLSIASRAGPRSRGRGNCPRAPSGRPRAASQHVFRPHAGCAISRAPAKSKCRCSPRVRRSSEFLQMPA
jgi:SAM-dependent methyltransferase